MKILGLTPRMTFNGEDDFNGLLFLKRIAFNLLVILKMEVVMGTLFLFIIAIALVLGWFVMIYNYSTTLIECKLASKWYYSFDATKN